MPPARRNFWPPTFSEAVQLVVALTAVAALAVSWSNNKKIDVVHVSVNSRMEELLALTRKASRAEGVKEELDREK